MVRDLTKEDYLLHYVSQKWRSFSFLITAFNVEAQSEKKILENLLVQLEKEGKIVSQVKNEKKMWRSTLTLANEYFDQQNFKAALGYFKTALQYDPKSSLILNSIADSYENLSNKDMAIKYRKLVLVDYPNSFHYIMNLGSTCISFGDYEEAKEVYLYCLEKFQDRAPYKQGIINILFQLTITNYLLEDYEEALKMINIILKLEPNNSVAIKLYEDIKRTKDTSIKKDIAELYDYFHQEDRRGVSTRSLYQFEERLVMFIYHKLKEIFGKEWFKHGVPFEIRRAILNFKRYEKRIYKYQEYLGFKDYIDIIEENWDNIFSKSFKNKKKEDIFKALNEIRIIRNRIYHYKEKFYKEDQDRLNHCISELYNYIPALSELIEE